MVQFFLLTVYIFELYDNWHIVGFQDIWFSCNYLHCAPYKCLLTLLLLIINGWTASNLLR